VRLAVTIAALAPKLRRASVLALTWQEHVDPDLRFITVHRHKTVGTLRRPQVVPISDPRPQPLFADTFPDAVPHECAR